MIVSQPSLQQKYITRPFAITLQQFGPPFAISREHDGALYIKTTLLGQDIYFFKNKCLDP